MGIKAKVINDSVPDEVIKNICEKDTLTRDDILELIGNTVNGKQYSQDAIIILKPEHGYAKGTLKESIETTLGLLIINKFLYEPIHHLVGYVNELMDKKQYQRMISKLTTLILSNKMTHHELVEWMDRREAFGNTLNTFFTPTPTIHTFIPPKPVMELKKKLIKENEEAIRNKDVITIVNNIEKRLLDESKKFLEDIEDPGLDLYKSGAKSSFDNNYKSRLFTGALPNPVDGSYDIITTNLYEGYRKEDLAIAGTAGIAAAYFKGVSTQVGGYGAKKANAAFQTVMIDEEGTDCGTNHYREILITESNYKDYLERNFFTNKSRTTTLLEENKNEFIGKVCKLREPCMCKTKKICSACAGKYFYRLGIKYVGLAMTNPYNTMVKRGMKNFHDITIKIHNINEEELNNLLIEV